MPKTLTQNKTNNFNDLQNDFHLKTNKRKRTNLGYSIPRTCDKPSKIRIYEKIQSLK